MTNPRPDTQEPREGRRAEPDMPLLPPSPITPELIQEASSSRQTSPSPSLDGSRASSPVSDISMSDASDNDQVAPSSSPETYQRGGRRGFSTEQLTVISNFYEATPYPSREQYQQLASTLNLDNKSIKLWFQNRRCKARKQGREPEAPRVSSDEDEIKGIKTKQHDVTDVKPITVAPVENTSESGQYKEMTIMSLPADHPFCQLLPSGPVGRRQRRPAARPSVDSPVARPPNARGRSKNAKKALHKVEAPLIAAPVPSPATVVVKPEVARLWRPIDDPRSASSPSPPQQVPVSMVKLERPPSTSSPLDLSVSLKRKRDDTPATSGDAMDTSGKKHAGETSALHPAALPAGYPMMFPGAFPFYGHPAGPTYMPVMPQMPFHMPHLPLGMYGQSVSMWPGSMPGMPQPQKPVR